MQWIFFLWRLVSFKMIVSLLALELWLLITPQFRCDLICWFSGFLHNTGATFVPVRVDSSSLSWLYICLHDTTTKCHAGMSHPRREFSPVGVRISLQYKISQRYLVNAKWPHVSVWNRSAGRLEWVAGMFAILNLTCTSLTWSVPASNEIWNNPVIM